MCAIVDASVKGELKAGGSPAGNAFLRWLLSGNGIMVLGGTKLREELYAQPASLRDSRLIRELKRAAVLREYNDAQIDSLAYRLHKEGACKSDDHHVIALAIISRARLLFSNDPDLHADFRDKNLVDDPRGSVYSTLREKRFKQHHKDLLANPDLCHRSIRESRPAT